MRRTVTGCYRDGVDWIAANDNPADCDEINGVAGYISVLMLADIFGKEPERVAADILAVRRGELQTPARRRERAAASGNARCSR